VNQWRIVKVGQGGQTDDLRPAKASKAQRLQPSVLLSVRRKQRAYYSSKARKHPLKAQVVVNQATGAIIYTAFGKGRVHDFRLFKQHRIPMLPDQLCLADKG
jgi:hypothetical protein